MVPGRQGPIFPFLDAIAGTVIRNAPRRVAAHDAGSA